MPLPNPPLASLPIVVFDTETTGLFTMSAWMVEIAGVRMSGSMVTTGVFQTLVRPDAIIPPDATRVHGITDDEVRDAPQTADVLKAFFDWAKTGTALKENGGQFRTIDDIISDLGFVPEDDDEDSETGSKRIILDVPRIPPLERPSPEQMKRIWEAIDSINSQLVSDCTADTATDEPHMNKAAPPKPVIFAAHNSQYDLGILSTAFRRTGLKPPAEFVCIDTCAWARRVLPLGGFSLEKIVDYIASHDDIEIPFVDVEGCDCLGIDAAMFAMQGFHRALCDSLHTAVVLSHLLQVTGMDRDGSTVEDLQRKFPGVVSFGIAEQRMTVELPLHLAALNEAIEAQADVQIVYSGQSAKDATHSGFGAGSESPSPKTLPRRIKPLGVYGMKGNAYLEAFCYIDGFVKTFRVDRIREVR